jgi:hypothetical protein
MRKNDRLRLALSRQTLRPLSPDALGQAAGGVTLLGCATQFLSCRCASWNNRCRPTQGPVCGR